MTRLIIALTLVAIATTANAITDYACVSDCMGRGHSYNDCMPECTSDNVQPGTLKAIFTGQSELITTPNGLPGYKCVYNLNGQTIVKIFAQQTCPSTIDVKFGYDKSKPGQPSPPSPPSPPPPPPPPP
ncbi:MAG TPA: hypothetical protein VK187_12560, partial [Geobacteraceae bacterium]|nr:hypothetical protein [Geobacteraceae bacterium]